MTPGEQHDEEWEYPLQDAPVQRSLPPAKYWVVAAILLLGAWLLPATWALLRAGLVLLLSLLPYIYIVLLSTWVFWLPAVGLLWLLILCGSLVFNARSTGKHSVKVRVPTPSAKPPPAPFSTPTKTLILLLALDALLLETAPAKQPLLQKLRQDEANRPN